MGFDDLTLGAVEQGLSGVMLRQQVTAANIANAATPGYQAKRVEFENQLKTAIDQGSPFSASPSVTPTNAANGLDGNNVRMDEETSKLMQSSLQYQALLSAASYKLGMWRTAIDGGR